MSENQPPRGWPEQPPARGGQPGQYGGQGQYGGGQQGQQGQQPPYGQQSPGSGADATVPRGVRPSGWQHPPGFEGNPPGYEETVAGEAQQPAWQAGQPQAGPQQPAWQPAQQQPAWQPNQQQRQPPSRAARPPRRRHRGRNWLIALVVLILVLVGVDFGAKAFAENAIASKIDSSGLGVKPSVDIEGFPFLTQVASRDLSQIDINASNFTVHQVVISSLHATATGVHPNASFNGATINKINGTVVVSFATVTNLIPIPGLTVSADPADGHDAIKFGSSLGGATGKIEHPSPNVIKVDVGNLTGLAGLASLIGGSALQSSYTFSIPKLPAGLVVRSINVTSQGIVATASAQNTTLSQ